MIYDSGDEEYLAGEFWFNNFVLTNSTTLYTSELAIHAINITIGQGSALIADYKGSAGGNLYSGEILPIGHFHYLLIF